MDLSGHFAELLKNLSSQDKEARSKAEALYKQAKASEPDNVVIGLMQVLARPNPQADAELKTIKTSACVYLRQQFVKTDKTEDFLFPRLTPQHKTEVAGGLLELFKSETDDSIRKKLGNIISKLAEFVANPDDRTGWLAPEPPGWPALLPTVVALSNIQVNQNPASCDSALRLLKDLVGTLKNVIVACQNDMGQLLQTNLACSDLKVKTATVLLICSMIEELEKKHWNVLPSTLPVVMSVCTQLAQSGQTEELKEILQSFIEIAEIEPDFFKKSAEGNPSQPLDFMSNVVKAKEADEALRQLALEFIVSFAEKKPKWLVKAVPSYAPLSLESSLVMMLEVEDGEGPLKEWAGRMDDEEGEEDVDEMFHSGEECIDRLVEALGMEAVSKSLFEKIGLFLNQEDWKTKHAALVAVKQTVEYIEDENMMKECAKLLLAHVDHAHPRVRYTALHAIGQLANDQAPQFQEHFHKEVMPMLLRKMDDPVDRVAAMAMSAFVSFGEELEDFMRLYSNAFMEKLGNRLTSSQHRGIREESITAIAVIAGVIGDEFKLYYPTIMPILKQIVVNANGEKEQRLRGKAFECMSLLGVAVGKEIFLPDAREAIEAMLKMGQQADETQREYIKEAVERIVHCLKKDFKPFCPYVLPNIFKKLDISTDAGEGQLGGGGDDDDTIEVKYQGKLVKVKTERFEEMHQSVMLLNSFCSEMEDAFYEYVQPCATALLPLFDASEELSYLTEDARGEAYTTWSLLIEVVTKSMPAQGVAAQTMASQLLDKIITVCMTGMKPELEKNGSVEVSELRAFSWGISQSLKTSPQGIFPPDKGLEVLQTAFKLIDASFARTETIKSELKKSNEGAPPELQDDEDAEEDPLEEEEGCRRALEEVIGALMKNNPAGFLQYKSDFAAQIQKWLTSKSNLVLALHFACDCLEHLKSESCQLWPLFMNHVFEGIGDKDPDVRTAAAYAVNLAASIPQFDEAAPEVFRRLAQVVGGPAPKKRDDSAKIAMDNAVAALFTLGFEKAHCCPPEVNAFAIALQRMPLKEDTEEAKKVHKKLVDNLMAQHAGLVGANQANLGRILSILIEVYKQENTSNKELDALILQVFKTLPPQVLQGCASSFSEKQQKKIEKLMS
eukprot:CAMPEP_0169096962 /NCGR_PEP_ID=MMETSP1015-20121227/19272_1 /TAXON_ID=342587 /ORGANISM="Karlodinium micrum, Strain CCMP2283" /LENGTH=1123 /DNA_ID=CAMNT_0009157749 /DNA_START=60 /DNA_END=3431 /DNA_ORIENTATION=+